MLLVDMYEPPVADGKCCVGCLMGALTRSRATSFATRVFLAESGFLHTAPCFLLCANSSVFQLEHGVTVLPDPDLLVATLATRPSSFLAGGMESCCGNADWRIQRQCIPEVSRHWQLTCAAGGGCCVACARMPAAGRLGLPRYLSLPESSLLSCVVRA